MPIRMPSRAVPVGRSLVSNTGASSAVKIGADATRIPARLDEICCSPADDQEERPGHLDRGQDHEQRPQQRAQAAKAPRRSANGSSTSAPSAVRMNTIIAGERSSSPILMNSTTRPRGPPGQQEG